MKILDKQIPQRKMPLIGMKWKHMRSLQGRGPLPGHCVIGKNASILCLALLLALTLLAIPRAANGQGNPHSQIIPGLIVILRPSGFDPSSFTLPRGRFLFGIDNRTGFEGLDFHLNRLTGDHVKEVKPRKGQHDYREVYDLSPGDYVLSESSHPKWVCRITITPN